MIKFFRRIRFELMEKNKTGKPALPAGRYLKYAIGEILLVVIGILIALQINNWNENRKTKKTELNLLNEVQINLEATLNEFKSDTIYNRQTIDYLNKIIYYIDTDLPYDKELDSAFATIPLWASPFAYTSAYKSIQDKGFDIIKNKDLKMNIQTMYDVTLNRLLIDVDKVEWTMSESTVNPFFTKHIRIINDGSLNKARPNNFESLKKNDEFINILNQLIRERTKSILYYRQAMNSIENLIDEISNELNLKDK